MEEEIDRLKTEKRRRWTSRHFRGCLKCSSYPPNMNESQYALNLLDENEQCTSELVKCRNEMETQSS